eukprot:scaffold22123_cov64-Phaeocystis_antarctica.AAC.2
MDPPCRAAPRRTCVRPRRALGPRPPPREMWLRRWARKEYSTSPVKGLERRRVEVAVYVDVHGGAHAALCRKAGRQALPVEAGHEGHVAAVPPKVVLARVVGVGALAPLGHPLRADRLG